MAGEYWSIQKKEKVMRDKGADFFIQQTEDSAKTVERFTMIGFQDDLDNRQRPILSKDSDRVFAKIVTLDNKSKYYIKTGTYGKIFNPIGLYSEGKESHFLSKIGKKAWNFKEVSPKVFDLYIAFLKTKNLAWLNNAERELS